ncbi:MAG: response regulator transcription factor [Phycisphaeraceae bacterium]
MAQGNADQLDAGKARLLLVEDSITLNRLVSHLLRQCGYEVQSCSDGAEAVEHVLAAMRDQRGFDVILMDVVMPKLNGCEAAYRLRQHGYAGKIVMLTASDTDYDLPRAFSAGADDYLAKPFTPSDLQGAVQRNLADRSVNPLTADITAA